MPLTRTKTMNRNSQLSHVWPDVDAKKRTFDLIDYQPFDEQWPIHHSQADVLQIVGAEGAGKSQVTANEVLACIPWCKLIYLVGAEYENTHKEFNYLVEGLLKLKALDPNQIRQPRDRKWEMVTGDGAEITTLSAKKGASAIIALGDQPDIIVLCEAGVIPDYSVFTAATRRVTRVRGRVILVGTLKDNHGWYAALSDELAAPDNIWQGKTYSLPAWINKQLYPGGRNDPEIRRLEATLPQEEFLRTVAAVRAPSKALVFSEFDRATHARPCPYNPDLPVMLWIDPGYYPSAYVVLAVQFYGDEVWNIDEVYLNFHTHPEIIAICKAKEWWSNAESGAIDIAGKQHHAEKSAVEIWREETGLNLITNSVGILDGISLHRSFLRSPNGPRLFHDPECKWTIREYGMYTRPADRDGNATSDIPIDRDNHAMKAIVYGLAAHFGLPDTQRVAEYGPNPVWGYRG